LATGLETQVSTSRRSKRLFYALILLSEQFLGVWNVIPQELKNKIPENIAEWVGMFVGVAMVLARLKKQPEIHPVPKLLGFAALPVNSISFDQAFHRLTGFSIP
jgi:hypothetical protein